MNLGIDPLVNFAFIKLFASPGNEPVLLAFLNAILQWKHPIVSLRILNPYNPKDFQDDKLTILDIKATDSAGRFFNLEMQTTPHIAFMNRIVFYGCELYTHQLREGDSYEILKPVYCICIVRDKLWPATPKVHHHFELIDRPSGRSIDGAIEIHTLELGMYNLQEHQLVGASQSDRWLYVLLHAEHYPPERLRELFPELEFLQAIDTWVEIQQKTEDKAMYDASQKAERDRKSALMTAEQRGIQIGEERGIEIGIPLGELRGKIKTLQELLGFPITSDSEFEKLSRESLSTLAAQLQTDLRNRFS